MSKDVSHGQCHIWFTSSK